VNPRAAFLIILVVVVAMALFAWLIVRWVGRQAGVRRAEYRRMKAERDLAINALERIDEIADAYRDLLGSAEGPLAIQVRQIVRYNRQKRSEIS